ncbi:MAG: CotH kinase family protein [Prolixibacteraceae bacterium]|jgi:hypothetical protein
MSSFPKLFILIALFSLLSEKTFSQVSFSSSNLPVIVINTNGQYIYDDPKIIATMGIIWNGPGQRNSVNDPKNNFNGKIGIETRGSSSQMFPKKSYGIETRSDDWQDVDVSLLGMPAESDWILYAPYSDKTLIRNVLTFTLDGSLGHYSPRCRYVELVLNGSYQGVYVLMEKIKRNKNRVDIAKLTTTDNSGEDVTGGYIIKIDKTTGSGGDGWSSDYYNFSGKTYYQYDYPKQEVITSAQKTYIQSYVRNMEKSLFQEKFSGTGSYHEFLNDTSFIDFMIINELSKNVDGYRLSSYLYKGKNEVMNCGPIWDFNLGYGNADYYNGGYTNGFQYQANLQGWDGQYDYWQTPFWWRKLMEDTAFVKKLKRRWTALREKELSNERISFVADSLTSLLSESQVRNFQKWPVLGQYVWPNFYVGYSYSSEVSWMKIWINGRLIFLDQMWPSDPTANENRFVAGNAKIYPNPFTDRISVLLDENVTANGTVEIYSIRGNLLQKQNAEIVNGEFQFSAKNTLIPGSYIIQVSSGNQILLRQKVLKIH